MLLAAAPRLAKLALIQEGSVSDLIRRLTTSGAAARTTQPASPQIHEPLTPGRLRTTPSPSSRDVRGKTDQCGSAWKDRRRPPSPKSTAN